MVSGILSKTVLVKEKRMDGIFNSQGHDAPCFFIQLDDALGELIL